MKKLKINIDKEKIKNIIAILAKKKKLFFILFVVAMFVYTATVLYKNVYLNLAAVDYLEPGNFFTYKKEQEMIKGIAENVKNKEKAVQAGISKQYKNPFGVKSSQSENAGSIYSGDILHDSQNKTLPQPRQ